MPKKRIPVTREDLQGALEDAIKPLALHLIRQDDDLRQIKENMMTKLDGQRMMERFDSISEWIITSKIKEPVQDHRLKELEATAAAHETRLTRLEQPRS